MSVPANDNGGEGTTLGDMLDRINRVQVSAELLAAALHSQTGTLPQDRPPGEAAAMRIFQLLMTRGFRPGELGLVATAIEFRLTALANVISYDGLLASPVRRDLASPAIITLEMLQVAADETLIEDADGEPTFDEHTFRCRLLAAVKTDGSAYGDR